MKYYFSYCLLTVIFKGLDALGRLEPDGKVVGGEVALDGQYPYALSFRVNDVHSCGATLIGPDKAVTVAHCASGVVSSYSILAGSRDRTVASCPTCEFRQVLTVSRHPDFSNNPSAGYPNDVAVLFFDPISTNENIQYADMALPGDGTFVDEECTIIGWGRTTPGGALPSMLHYGALTGMSTSECLAVWGSSRIYTGHLCTQSTVISPCTGDNGGPVICNGKFAGANSWGDSQCGPANPSVNIRISYYRTWIEVQ